MEFKFIDTKYHRTGERESDAFVVGDKYYWADLTPISCYGTECMIFKANKTGKVINWSEVYCNRGIEVSREQLIKCIEEFIHEELCQ